MTLSVALDLGSTRIKAARLEPNGRLAGLVSQSAPELKRNDPIHEGDLNAYLTVAEQVLLQALDGCQPQTPVTIASQRSSFALWDRVDGRPATALISWQDRRSEQWCDRHAHTYGRLGAVTGLPLSPHYAGTKLAHMLAKDSLLNRAARDDRLLFGTLETCLVWRLTRNRCHQTDISMAARTLMADVRTSRWSNQLLDFIDVPVGLLPHIVATTGQDLPLSLGGRLTATVADQAASLVAASSNNEAIIAVNLGTGGFVMTCLGERFTQLPGYLTAPIVQQPDGSIQYALEGTINAIGPALARYPGGPALLGKHDPSPDLFCLPDSAGVAAPYWRSDQGFTLSQTGADLPLEALRRTVLEGIIFRVCQIVEDFHQERPMEALLVSGGLAAEPFIVQGLAACSGLKTGVSCEKEMTLWGAASLAAPEPATPPPVQPVGLAPGQGRYLRAKFLRWRSWVGELMDGRQL